MADSVGTRVNRPAWVDLSTSDPEAARQFYGTLFGWQVEVSSDPQYGGYGIAKLADGGEDVAGIGTSMTPGVPPVWNLYIGTDDAAALGDAVLAAGGTVIAPAFDVGDMGRMAVFQDPAGAFISGWQAASTGSFRTGDVGTFTWAELNARGIDRAIAFYDAVFGWTVRTTPLGAGQSDYHEFQLDGSSILGGMEMSQMVPAEVPSYWMPYFRVADADEAFRRALDAGATEVVAPTDYPGGRFAIVSDPQGAMFGLLKPAG